MAKTPARLMHVEGSNQVPVQEKLGEEDLKLVQTMAKEGGLSTTYKMFNTRTFRESMTIPDKICNEMETTLRTRSMISGKSSIHYRLRRRKPWIQERYQFSTLP